MSRILMNLIPDQMQKMILGTKTVELRLNDFKRQSINVDDIIKFQSTQGPETLSIQIIQRKDYEDFDALYQDYTAIEMGYDEDDIANADDMLSVYVCEDIQKYGVVAFHFKVLD